MPQKELERLQAVHRFLNLEINKDHELQEIAELAAELCDVPIAIITVDDEIRYVKSDIDLNQIDNLRANLFHNFLAEQKELIVIPDASKHERFFNSPLVVGFPKVRFYAGAPLITHDGHILGYLCIADTRPGTLNAANQRLMRVLAKRIVQIMEFDFSLGVLKQQFLEAKDAEIKLRSFFESSASCHLLIGRDLEVIAYNKNMYRFLKRVHQVKLYQGIKVSEILHSAYLDDFIKDYKLALSGTPVKYERFVPYANGENIWWYVTFEPGYDQDGEIIGISYNATDITEAKLYEEKILAQNESLKEIAHIQSHEFRKPVASILGFIELFKSNGYRASKEELILLEKAAGELDEKIRMIVDLSEKE